MNDLSFLMTVGWTLAALSAVTGATMVVVGMFEELLAIIRFNSGTTTTRRP